MLEPHAPSLGLVRKGRPQSVVRWLFWYGGNGGGGGLIMPATTYISRVCHPASRWLLHPVLFGSVGGAIVRASCLHFVTVRV